MPASKTQTAFQDAANGVDTVIVPAQAGTRIVVYAAVISNGAAGASTTFNSKGSGVGTPISGSMTTGVNGGFVLPPSGGDEGWFSTKVGEALTVTNGAATSVTVAYRLQR